MSFLTAIRIHGSALRFRSIARSQGCRGSKHQPMILRLFGAVMVVLVLILLIATVAPRLTATPEVNDPPQFLLPGNLLPASLGCSSPMMCHYEQDGRDIALNYDQASRRILDTTMEVENQTLGNLIVQWGTPNSYLETFFGTIIYWDMRTVYVIACSVLPNSPVTLIAYGPAPGPTSPWRGFTHLARNNASCKLNGP